MVRRLRLWEKKRGDRRTGSRLVAGVGEALFFGLLFVLGTAALTWLVMSQAIHPNPQIYQPGFGFWVGVLVLVSFILIGGGGTITTVLLVRASAERRLALVGRAKEMELIRDALPPQEFPTIPRDVKLTDSPGITLTYRLPSFRPSVWRLLTVTVLSLVLSGFASVLLVVFSRSYLAGRSDWWLLWLAVPYVVCGIWVVRHFVRLLWQQSRIGPTYVEISDHPLRPGSQYEIFVSQAGRLIFRRLGMSLVCEEEATFRQGTDVRTETRVVFEQSLFAQENVTVERGSPFKIQEWFTVPETAMHTFQSGHNAVNWRLVVVGEPLAWPKFTRSFPVLIYPRANGKYLAQTGRPAPRTQADDGTADQSAVG